MTQSAKADLSTPKYRERELYSIPISSSWFRWDEIHETERRSLPEFFDGGSYSRSPRVYKEYRDFIINKYREDPFRCLTFTDARKSLVGDVGTLRKVFLFLEKWGLINLSAFSGNQKHLQPSEGGGGPLVVVEDGPTASLRVVPALSSSSSASIVLTGGESGFRLPRITSFSDAFRELTPGIGLVCGYCGIQYCSRLSGLSKPSNRETSELRKEGNLGQPITGLELYKTATESMGTPGAATESHLEEPQLSKVSDGLSQEEKEILKAGITMCSKCSRKDTGNEKTEVDLKANEHADEKNLSPVAWTDAETLLLLEAVLKHGDHWDLIAQHVRTKSKLDCIARLIHLPFGEHMLGTIRTKSSNTNLIMRLEEYKYSSQASNDNSHVFIETDGEQQKEISKTEGVESTIQERPSKRRCYPSFIGTADSFLKKIASLSTISDLHTAAAAVDGAIGALCHENTYAKLSFEIDGDKIAKPVSSPFKNEFKSDFKVDDDDTERNKPTNYVPEKNFGATSFRIRAAISATLAAAAARAKLIADQEEREIDLLLASIIQAQLKKLQYKIKHLTEVELLMEKEFNHIQQLKEFMLHEWVNVLRKLVHAGIPRWLDQGFSKTLLHTIPL